MGVGVRKENGVRGVELQSSGGSSGSSKCLCFYPASLLPLPLLLWGSVIVFGAGAQADIEAGREASSPGYVYEG